MRTPDLWDIRRVECMHKTSVICQTTSHARCNFAPLCLTAHLKEGAKVAAKYWKLNVSLILNVIVRGKRTSRLMTKNSCRDMSFVKMNGNTMVFLARMHERYELAVYAKLVTYKPIILACKLQRHVIRNDRFLWHFDILKAISRT